MEYRGVETTGINDYSNKRGKPMLAQSMDKLIEESIQKGMEEGMEKKSLETALKMLDDGLSVDVVAKYTGLSEEAIQGLKDT